MTPPPGERFDGFTSRAEERWLAGDGPAPATAAERLPPRAGVLIPRAGAGHRWVETLRTARLWVDDGAVMFRDPSGATARRVEPGRVRGCWWVADAAVEAVGLPPSPAGWLVLLSMTGPELALRLRDWEPPLGDPDAAETVRAAGAQGLAAALGADLEAVADPTEALQRIGQVPDRAVLTLDVAPSRPYALAVLATPLVLLAVYAVLLTLLDPKPATLVTIVLLVGSALAYDLVPWAARLQRTRGLPRRVQQWCPAGARNAGLGLTSGPAGQEVVIADGYGFEAWLPGPHLGGLASLVVAEDDRPWGVLGLDRDQRRLLVLDPGGLDVERVRTSVAGWGIVVSEAGVARAAYDRGRRLSRRTSSTLDIEGNLAATFVSGVCTPLFWVVAGLATDRPALAGLWWVVGAALLVLRLAMRWRRVL